jgi:hypothetical protein
VYQDPIFDPSFNAPTTLIGVMMKRAALAAVVVLGTVVPTVVPYTARAIGPVGGGMVTRPGGRGMECQYRPNQLIAPSGTATRIGQVLGVSATELTSLIPDGLQAGYPGSVAKLSLYSIPGADPLSAGIALQAAGIVAAPNYISSYAPGVRTWAPGEDAVAVGGSFGPITPPNTGYGKRIGVIDTGLASKFGQVMTGSGSVTYVSAQSMQAVLSAKKLVSGNYTQPEELATGRAAGHGTFISGLIRRVAPAATIIVAQVPFYDASDAAFTVPASTGFTTNSSSRVDDAALSFMLHGAFMGGDTIPDIDVLSISFGSYGCNSLIEPAAGEGEFRTPIGLRNTLLYLWERSGRTLRVAAAAGNDRTDERFYPAAFAATSCFDPANVPLNGMSPVSCRLTASATSSWLTGVTSTASAKGNFSNFGAWAGTQADGSDVISRRHLLEWASWSGTSFAAPCAAISSLLNGWMNWRTAPKDGIDCHLGL